MKKIRLLPALLLLLAAALSLPAAISLSTTRADWRTAAGGGTGDIVDNLNSGTLDRGTYGITLANFTLATFPGVNTNSSVDGTGYLTVPLNQTQSRSMTFTFANSISAFGFDLNPQNSSVGMSVNVAFNNGFSTSYTLPATDVTEFRGFVSDTAFTSFTLTSSSDGNVSGMDNVEAFSVVPVPEPSCALLLLLGAPVWILNRRKRVA